MGVIGLSFFLLVLFVFSKGGKRNGIDGKGVKSIDKMEFWRF
jgi:hypothetical protein